MLKKRGGSVYVEASLLMPAAILIAAALIFLTVHFFTAVCRQTDEHEKELEKQPAGSEALYVRKADKIERELERYAGSFEKE